MFIQLNLILLTLSKLQQNIFITCYRKHLNNLSKKNTSVVVNVSFLNFFFKQRENSSNCLRAANIKQYRFGFDLNLFPLKNRQVSIQSLKKLPILNIDQSFLITPLGAWGTKYNHKEKYRSIFFKIDNDCFFNFKKLQFNNNSLFFIYNWINFIPFIWFFIFNNELSLLWSYLSISNPGFFFLKKLDKNNSQHLLLSEIDNKYLNDIDSIFYFFFNSKISNNLYFQDPEELLYRNYNKLPIKAQFSSWVIYKNFFYKYNLGSFLVILDFYFFFLFFLVLKWLFQNIKSIIIAKTRKKR